MMDMLSLLHVCTQNDVDDEVAATVGGTNWIESEGDVSEVPVRVITPKGESHDVSHDVSHGGTSSDIPEEAGRMVIGRIELGPGDGGSPVPPPGLLQNTADVCAVMEGARSDDQSALVQKLKEVGNVQCNNNNNDNNYIST